MITKKSFKNLIELVEFFHTEEDCIRYLKDILWGNGKYCPFCGSNHIHEFKDIKRNRCYECKKDFSIRKGTIFEDSNIKLKKWFMASYIYNAHKKGISSCQLAKDISVSQPTAWFMLQRLRHASRDRNENFKGTCEIDETYIGGKAENMHLNKRVEAKGIFKKSIIMGIVNRETKQVKTIKVEDTTSNSLVSNIYKNIEEGSFLITDEHKAYKSIGMSYNHRSCNHSKGEYNKEEKFESRKNGYKAYKINTNSIEGFWSQLKRGLYGVYHWASEKHIQKYCDEFSFRYNTKAGEDFERFGMFITNNIQGKLSYKSLIA
jgi:transposase-like protein